MPFLVVLDNEQSKIDGVQKFMKEKLPPEPEPTLRQFEMFYTEENKEIKTNLNKKKGTDFENYVGSQYKEKNYVVEYYGQEKNAHDLGRDLICKYNNYTVIVQCKCYKDTSTISIYDIYILYASMKHYASTHTREIVSASLWTNQNMIEHSQEAYSAALSLGIQIYQGVMFK